MILKDGTIIPVQPKRWAGRIKQPPYQTPFGLTVCQCGVCRKETILGWEARIQIDVMERSTVKGRFVPEHNYEWREHLSVNRYPVIQRVWVCERCYGRAKDPVIRVRPKPDVVTRIVVDRDTVDITRQERLNALKQSPLYVAWKRKGDR